MKTLALLFFLAGGSVVLADTELLQNSDFSDGISHWDGDCHSVGSSSDDSGATSGVVVKLRSGEWTKINQDFEGKQGNYLLTITYTTSPGLTFSQLPEDYSNVPLKMGLPGLGAFDSTPPLWCMMVVDTGIRRYHYWQITPKLGASGVQKVVANVQLSSDDNFEKGFFLGFPPGDGFINIQSISLISKDAATASTQ